MVKSKDLIFTFNVMVNFQKGIETHYLKNRKIIWVQSLTRLI
jgi:hypothetical protein